MDSSPLLEQYLLEGNHEDSSTLFLLNRGLDYVQRECYAEGVAFLVLARERLSISQIHLAEVLDVFIQGYAEYQRIQQALQDASARFAEAHGEQQARVKTFVAKVTSLTRGQNASDHFPSLFTTADAKNLQLAPSLPPQNLQATSSALTPPLLRKDTSPLAELSITCFGRFEVRRSGTPIALCPSRTGQSILRYLVARSGHYATSDTLQAMLWPEDQPEIAQNKLHIAISAIRRSLNHGCTCEPGCGYIMCKNQVYYLNPAVVIRTDVDEFLHYYQAGRQTNEGRVALYEKACCLYTGPFLPEEKYADWSALPREQLSQTYLAMCRVLTDHYFKIKQYEDATKWATAILIENRCDESAYRHLMLIYTAQGCRSEVIQQYQCCERILRQELGVQPLPETVQLFEALLRGETISNATARI